MLQFPYASKILAFLLVFVCAFLLAGNASAQEDEGRMKELVKQGTQAFSEKRYADAASLFEQAHEAKPNPTLLKNAMVAWYKGNDCDKALHVGARYYREASDAGQLEAKDQSEIQTVISCGLNLSQQRIDEQKFTEAEDLLFTATSAGPTSEQTSRIAKLRDELRAGRAAVSSGSGNGDGDQDGTGPIVDDGPSDGVSPLAITGWTLAGIGAAGLIGAAVYALTGRGAERDAVDACRNEVPPDDPNNPPTADDYLPYYECLDARLPTNIATAEPRERSSIYIEEVLDPINSVKTNSIIGYAVSGTVAAAGVGILVYHYFFSDPGTEPSESVILTPTIRPDTVGAQLLWRF